MSAADDAMHRLQQLGERIDERSLRERALIFLALVGAIYVGASQVLFAPLGAEQQRLEQRLKSAREQAALFDRNIQTFLAKGGSTEAERRLRLQELHGELRALDNGTLDKRLVPPREMAKLVAQLLQANARLRLLKIESLAPVALQAPTAGAKDAAGKNAAAANPVESKGKVAPATSADPIYRHGMRLQFDGEYRDIVNYLRALEAMPWRLYWGELALDVKQHPRTRVSLVIYTLSLREGWIGA